VRNLRLYRILRTALVIATVAWRYFWLQKRDGWKRWRPTQQAWERAHAKTGTAIYKLATQLGGAFVKLGQVLGARADVMPSALVAPLRGLHDRVPPRPFAKLARHVERELGKPIDEVFAHVEPKALAAASLAQVHRARLVSGEDVALKVQYPEAARLFPIDLGAFRRAVRVARWLNPGLDLRVLVDELAELVTLELDFEREAASTERVRKNLVGDPDVVVPVVHRATRKVLVLGFVKGTPLSAPDELRARGVDARDVCRRVAALYAKMIFEHGFFHGDPHPGNILVLDDKRLGLLDFGLAKELPPGFAANAAQLFMATMAGNAAAAVTAARALGFVVADERVPELLVLVRALVGDYQNARDLAQHLRRGSLEVPSHFTLIIRTLIILNGVSHILAPGERVIPTALVAALSRNLARAAS